jgi:hypothetical protein
VLAEELMKIDRYTDALPMIVGRLAPLLGVLRAAAATDPELAAVWHQIAERRAQNMRLFAADWLLRAVCAPIYRSTRRRM